MFVVRSIVVQMKGQGSGSINGTTYCFILCQRKGVVVYGLPVRTFTYCKSI